MNHHVWKNSHLDKCGNPKSDWYDKWPVRRNFWGPCLEKHDTQKALNTVSVPFVPLYFD